jgi:ABC-type Co2+ transport system permease subunit
MNIKNLLIASVVGGVVSAVVSNTPYLEFVNCLLCAGFWGGALLAVWLYRRLGGSVTLGQAAAVGALAGVWHAVLGILLSFVGLAGAAGFANTMRTFLPPDAMAGIAEGTTGLAGIAFNLVGVVIDIVLGTLGGLLGGAIFQARQPRPAA